MEVLHQLRSLIGAEVLDVLDPDFDHFFDVVEAFADFGHFVQGLNTGGRWVVGLVLHHDGTFPVFHHDFIGVGYSVDSKVLNRDLNRVSFHQVLILNFSSIHCAFIRGDELFAVLIPPGEVLTLVQQPAETDVGHVVEALSFD